MAQVRVDRRGAIFGTMRKPHEFGEQPLDAMVMQPDVDRTCVRSSDARTGGDHDAPIRANGTHMNATGQPPEPVLDKPVRDRFTKQGRLARGHHSASPMSLVDWLVGIMVAVNTMAVIASATVGSRPLRQWDHTSRTSDAKTPPADSRGWLGSAR